MEELLQCLRELELPANQLGMSYYYRTQLIILHRVLDMVKSAIAEAENGLRLWDVEDI